MKWQLSPPPLMLVGGAGGERCRILFTVGNVGRDIGRYSGRYSGRQSVDNRSTLGRQSVDTRSTLGRYSVDTRSTVGRQSVDIAVDSRSRHGR